MDHQIARRSRAGRVLLALGALAPAMSAPGQVMLSAAWADTRQLDEPDEAVELFNAGSSTADLSGWSIEDDEGGRVTLPPGATLAPLGRAWLAREAAAFRVAFGALPQYEAGATDPSVPPLAGTWPALANTGDEVRLLDAAGAVVDVLVYGDAVPAGGGWIGAPASPGWDPASGSSSLLVTRDRIEGDEACVADTDSAADWDDLRLERPGATHLLPVTFPAPVAVQVAVGPDATFELLESVVSGARSSLRVEVYYVDDPAIVALLQDALRRGVSVRLLLEGETVGGVSDLTRWAADTLASSGADVRWLRADRPAGELRRHPYHHGKTVVADDAVTHVSTENMGDTGTPVDPTFGNRGWAARIDDLRVASWFAALLDEDADLRHADVAPHDPVLDAPPAGTTPDTTPRSGWHHPTRSTCTATDVVAVEAVVSPDHAALRTHGILGLLASATASIDAQQLSLPAHWGRISDPPDLQPSPVVQSLLDAARRGVRVRVLLDASWYSVQPSDPRDNDDTCALLDAVAAAEGLALDCRLLDPRWLSLETIHVKGWLVDGHLVHVGSINGTSTSYRLNRETAVQIDSVTAAACLGAEFERDWQVAGVGARVPAEVHGLRVAKTPAGELLLSWEPPVAAAPAIDVHRVYAGSDAASEVGWTSIATSPTTRATAPAPAAPLSFLLVVGAAIGPGGIIEGPSGHHDQYFDR